MNVHVVLAAGLAVPLAAGTGEAATISFGFAFQAPVEERSVSVFDATPGDGVGASQTSEVGVLATGFSLPRFDPAMGMLTGVDVTYRLGNTSPAGINSVVRSPDDDCGAAGSCAKTLDILAVFTYGLAIEGVPGNVIVDGDTVSVAGFGFDLALISELAEGSSADGSGQALALSGFQDGDEVTRSFIDAQTDVFLGPGEIGFSAFNTVAAQLGVQCLPTPGPVTTCSETAAVFITPDFEVDLTYTFDEPAPPMPAPIPLPAGLPLLGGALLGLAGWRRLTSSGETSGRRGG